MDDQKDQNTKLDLLWALRARLDLEEGIGVRYVSAPCSLRRDVERAITVAVKGGTGSVTAASAARKAPRPSRPENVAATVPNTSKRVARPAPVQSPLAAPAAADSTASRNPAKEACLADPSGQVMRCESCELAQKRNSVVWGEGNPNATVMFIGDAPGRDEDLQNRPFVGLPGKLLTDIIEKGMKIPRDSVYLTYAVKCRPPGNRNPRPGEIAACLCHLTGQIETVNPRVIVSLGEAAGCTLLNLPPKTPDLRGKWLEYHGIPLRIIHSPSYLLRQRRDAASRTRADLDTWNDIKEIMEKL